MVMYVVRRAFKSAGKRYNPGDVIDDIARVKRVKSKIDFNKIVVVTEQNFDSMAEYFKRKFGVDIPNKFIEPETPKPIFRPAKIRAGKLVK